jgi:dUTPase
MERPEVILRRLSNSFLNPTQSAGTSNALDFYSAAALTLRSATAQPISLDFALIIPEGYHMELRSHEWLAARGIIAVSRIIDHTYRSRVIMTLMNTSNCDYRLEMHRPIVTGVVYQDMIPEVYIRTQYLDEGIDVSD